MSASEPHEQNRLAETENDQPQKPVLKGEGSMTDADESTPRVLCAACGHPHIASLDGDDYGSLDGECSEFVPPISLGQAWVSRVTDANAPDSPSIIGAPEPTRREFYERLRIECDALRAESRARRASPGPETPHE